MTALRPIITLALALGLWQAIVWLAAPPPFILPPPARVLTALLVNGPVLAEHALQTLAAIIGGLGLGAVLGIGLALAFAASPALARHGLPIVVSTQALPVFALAPILVLWFGFGLSSKIAMTTLIVLFPVALAYHEGMRRTDPGLVDLARLWGLSAVREVIAIRAVAGLPALAAGLKGATGAAPMAAIVGEWVGAAAGLGFVMIQANARMQTDLLFAAVVVLALMAAALYALVARLLDRALPWAADSAAGRSGS